MICVALLECFNYLLRKSYIQEIRKTNEAKKFKLENQDLLQESILQHTLDAGVL
jgi:hypothetical protein